MSERRTLRVVSPSFLGAVVLVLLLAPCEFGQHVWDPFLRDSTVKELEHSITRRSAMRLSLC